MTIALVPSAYAAANGSTGATTGNVDTTGANFYVAGAGYEGGAATVTDGDGDTVTNLTQTDFGGEDNRISYVQTPTIGASKHMAVSAGNGGIAWAAFSGVKTSAAFDAGKENGNATFSTSLATGSITPSVDGCLIIATLMCDDLGTPSIDSGFTLITGVPFFVVGGGGPRGAWIAYKIQTTKTAVNPTWTSAGANIMVARIAAFKPEPATGVTVAPGVGVLTATGFAPTVAVSNNKLVAPGVAAVTVTGFAPTVSVSDNKNVQPGTGTATLTGFAPTVAVTDNKNVQPGVGTAVFTGFAPLVSGGGNIIVAPGVGSATLAGFAPTVSISDNKNVQPGVGSLAASGFAPTVNVSNNKNVAPGVGTLTCTGFAPAVAVSANQFVAPGTGQLVFTGFRPQVITGNSGRAGPPPLRVTAQLFRARVTAIPSLARITPLPD